jgi:hypothetical protein
MNTLVKKTLGQITYRLIEISTRLIYLFSSADKVYDNLFRFCNILSKATAPLVRVFKLKLTTSLFRRHIFSHALTTMNSFNRHWRPKYSVEGIDFLQEICNRGEPIICCSVHFGGLLYAVPKVFDDLGYEVVVISATEQRKGWDWGLSRPASLLFRNNQVLLRLRQQLRLRKRTVTIALVDYDYSYELMTGKISPNMFRFAESLSIPVLFFVSILQTDGSILIKFDRGDQGITDSERIAEKFAEWLKSKIGWDYKIEAIQHKP